MQFELGHYDIRFRMEGFHVPLFFSLSRLYVTETDFFPLFNSFTLFLIPYFRYRKFNLFNDDNITRTSKPDYSTFITDFNVTFGLFICFDIVLHDPAVKLVERGIRNFIMPTMWFSVLPFATGK